MSRVLHSSTAFHLPAMTSKKLNKIRLPTERETMSWFTINLMLAVANQNKFFFFFYQKTRTCTVLDSVASIFLLGFCALFAFWLFSLSSQFLCIQQPKMHKTPGKCLLYRLVLLMCNRNIIYVTCRYSSNAFLDLSRNSSSIDLYHFFAGTGSSRVSQAQHCKVQS